VPIVREVGERSNVLKVDNVALKVDNEVGKG
jgi:hypothetical protein